MICFLTVAQFAHCPLYCFCSFTVSHFSCAIHFLSLAMVGVLTIRHLPENCSNALTWWSQVAHKVGWCLTTFNAQSLHTIIHGHMEHYSVSPLSAHTINTCPQPGSVDKAANNSIVGFFCYRTGLLIQSQNV